VKAQAYPPMLITGGLNDPRVTYWEPAKWAAKLRSAKTDDNLLLLKINMGAGHGGKSGRWEHLRELAEAMPSCSPRWAKARLNRLQAA
jgi:oligopeptidase B